MASKGQSHLPCLPTREAPLSPKKWASFFDKDGRICNESEVRRCIFRGGIDPTIRRDVWRYLFGIYPFNSTEREREVVAAELRLRYDALKQRWKSVLELSCADDERTKLCSPSYLVTDETDGGTAPRGAEVAQPAAAVTVGDPDVFLKLQAQVYAGRQSIDIKVMKKAIRVIDKDVPRNDRDHPYFKGAGNPNLRVLRDVLITFAAFHPDLGYSQGMNDILSRFLVTMDDEQEAYWCLAKYLERIHVEFLEQGMVDKLETVKQLLGEMDAEFRDFFVTTGMDDFMFCHRWLLLSFKREFAFDESLKLFEILCSHHLEISSLEAEKAKRKEELLEKERTGGEASDRLEVVVNQEYTFELFVCLAILQRYRSEIMASDEASGLYQIVNGLSMHMSMEELLVTAEELFFKYCRKSVAECFMDLTMPAPMSPTST
ncbi:TBC1 domain family member 17-like [Sycon ciliatum]|uniref:TBC1 domain family member 17-like n=1 Tax=Sycon ciliatum TaxID=27933 RepID=UPI0020AB453A|eukprot:scpid79891/ scgid16900/ TBC1 domain family member 15; GTPase-activating protein RAB7